MAATNVIEDVVKISKIEALAKQFPDAIVIPIHAEESLGKNKLPLVFASYIRSKTGLELDNGIIQTNKTSHTGSSAIHRLFAVPTFEGKVFENEYILVDDVATSGSTFKALKEYIELNGGKVVAATTLFNASHRQTGYGGHLKIKENTVKQLENKFDLGELDDLLFEYGISKNHKGLTNGQGKYLSTFSSVDSIRTRFINEGYAGSNRYMRSEMGKTSQNLRPQDESLKQLSNSNKSREQLNKHLRDVDEPLYTKAEPQETQISDISDFDSAEFEKELDSILYNKADNDIFYSQVERTVENFKQDKMSSQQALAMIKKTPGVKAEELEWLGLETFLDDKKSVTKQELLDFIGENKVEVQESLKAKRRLA